MLNMSKINFIRDEAMKGKSLSQIAREANVDIKTVRKYIVMDDFSPKFPPTRQRQVKSILDPFKEQILVWLKEDEGRWAKQQHTATRIYDHLREKCGY